MSKLEKLKEKARSLEAKDPKGAIEAWQHVLKGQEEDGDPNPDLTIFNRIGDLYLKVREPARAANDLPQARQAVRLQGLHGRGQAEFRRVCRADAQGWKDPARLRRPEGVRRHLGGERTPAPDAGRPPADVWRSGAAPRRCNGGSRGAQASTA